MQANLIKKINLILCIVISLVIVGQLYMISFEPFFLMKETETEFSVKEADAGQVPYPHEIGLFEMVWLKFHDDAAVVGAKYGGWGDNLTTMLDELGDFKDYPNAQAGFEDRSNFYVMGVVGATVLGLVVIIMSIFTQKSIVGYCFSLAWAAVSLWGFFNSNPLIQKLGMPYAYGTVLPTIQLLTVVGAALIVLRGFPCFFVRFKLKKPRSLV